LWIVDDVGDRSIEIAADHRGGGLAGEGLHLR